MAQLQTNIRRRRLPGFTLVELMVVVSIIVVVIAIAVPTLRALSGGRSIDAAANQISAALTRARTEALGLQEPRGILFVRDPATTRIGLILVGARDANTLALDAIPDVDMLLLPSGVEVQTIDDAALGTGTPQPRTDDGYIGYNPADTMPVNTSGESFRIGGVILFDGHGRVISRPYSYLLWDRFAATHLANVLKVFSKSTPTNNSVALTPPTFPPTLGMIRSQTGFVVFDGPEFTSQFGGSRDADFDPQLNTTETYGAQSSEFQEEQWIDQNGVPFLVNRYSGAILRAS